MEKYCWCPTGIERKTDRQTERWGGRGRERVRVRESLYFDKFSHLNCYSHVLNVAFLGVSYNQ